MDAAHVGAELNEATLVFVGVARSIEPLPGPETGFRGRFRVTLEVTRRWKGPEAPAYVVKAGPASAVDLCIARFEEGETYLVFAYGDHVASCRAWKRGGSPPFASVGSIADMNTVVEELDRLSGRDPGARPRTVDRPLLFGIGSLLVAGNAIEVTEEESLPVGVELQTRTSTGSKATIKVGESFDVTDKHHYGHSYKLLAIEKGIAKIEMTIWTAFLGEKPTRFKSTIDVRPYVTGR